MTSVLVSDPSRKFSDELMEVRDRWHCKNHPFYQGWRDGTLDMKNLGFAMVQHMHHVITLLPHFGHLFMKGPADCAEVVLENLAEESGILGGGSGEREAVHHNDLILRFTRHCGYPDDLAMAMSQLPAWQCRTYYYIRVIHEEPGPVFMSMIACLESQEVGQHGECTVPGLINHYGFDHDDPTIKFFTEHEVADVEHGARALSIADHYITDPDERTRTLRIAENCTKLKWFAFNELYNVAVKKEMPLLPEGVTPEMIDIR